MGQQPFFKAGRGSLRLFVVGLVLVAAGCATLTADRGRPFDGRVADQSLEEAKRMINGGDASAAIPRLVQLISAHPRSHAATEARYWQGVAYFKLGSFRESMEALEEYERLAPQGDHRDDSAKLLAQMGKSFNKQYANVADLDAKIEEARKAADAAPTEPAKKLSLADLLWVRGAYPQAGEVYQALVKANPEYAQDATVKSRVEFQAGGKYVLLTPEELQRRQAQAEPLVVMNTSGFASNRDSFTHEHRNYVVAGQVVNRGSAPLYGVQVNVTVYGLGNAVFDTNTANIGRLNPGEIRAFSIRFANFENIDNISRYDCQGTFER